MSNNIQKIKYYKKFDIYIFVAGFVTLRVDGLNREKMMSLTKKMWENRGHFEIGFSIFIKLFSITRR